VKLGRKIKSIRTGRGITIQDIAERSGLSKGFLSQVENDKTSPSLNTLERIAEALETSLTYLLLDEQQAPAFARRGERQVLIDEASQGRLEYLSPTSGRSLQLVLVDLPAGRAAGDGSHQHEGEEACWVLSGSVQVSQGESSATLQEGDAYHWDGSVPHVIENHGPAPARLLVAMSPPAPIRISMIRPAGQAHAAGAESQPTAPAAKPPAASRVA
jgi:transcriptional regulator with XRE-family HTH domain